MESNKLQHSKLPLGRRVELLVCKLLNQRKYRVLTSNFSSRFGEIDIIAIHQNTLVFIEVKARTSTQFGQPYEAVTPHKLEKIIKTGHYFRQKYQHKNLPQATRVDVASVLVDQSGQIKDFQLLQNVTR